MLHRSCICLCQLQTLGPQSHLLQSLLRERIALQLLVQVVYVCPVVLAPVRAAHVYVRAVRLTAWGLGSEALRPRLQTYKPTICILTLS